MGHSDVPDLEVNFLPFTHQNLPLFLLLSLQWTHTKLKITVVKSIFTYFLGVKNRKSIIIIKSCYPV